MSGAAIRENHPTTEWGCRLMYNANEQLKVCTKKEKGPTHLQRFVAKYNGQAWHADLHYLQKDNANAAQKYLISFIDDRSRLILHYEVLEQKTSALCAEQLTIALTKIPPGALAPKTMIIDNGMEFVGNSILMKYSMMRTSA